MNFYRKTRKWTLALTVTTVLMLFAAYSFPLVFFLYGIAFITFLLIFVVIYDPIEELKKIVSTMAEQAMENPFPEEYSKLIYSAVSAHRVIFPHQVFKVLKLMDEYLPENLIKSDTQEDDINYTQLLNDDFFKRSQS